MKLFDKLKNALFEEEYVEVEEKPKPVKKEKPIAKKIVLPEQKREVKKEMPEKEIEEVVEPPKKDFKFPAILEDDFIDLTRACRSTSTTESRTPKRRKTVICW